MMTAALFATPVARVVGQPAAAVSGAAAPAPNSRAKSASCAVARPSGDKGPLPPKVPEWELAELTAEAEFHNQQIVESETSLLDDYWLLGRLLERVRGNFKRGTWLPWLGRRGIDHTRAKRARLLAQEFSSAEELRGLSLHEALRIARQRKKERNGRAIPNRVRQFMSAAKKLLAMAGELADDESACDYSSLADEVGAAAAALCRACRRPEDVQAGAAEAVDSAADAPRSDTPATATRATSGPCARRAVIDQLERPAQPPFAPTGFIPVARMIASEPETVTPIGNMNADFCGTVARMIASEPETVACDPPRRTSVGPP